METQKYLKLTNLLDCTCHYYFINMQHVVGAHLKQFVMSAG